MAADDNLFHLEGVDGVEDDALGGHVVRGDDVGNVAVDEDITGLGIAESGLRDTRVGTSEPKDRWSLAFGA